VSRKEEEEWKESELESQRKKQGYLLVARVGGKIAATSGAKRERGKGSDNILLGIAVAKKYRGLHLGEKLLRLNIKLAKKKLKARNVI
jgi:ribosomal protein S18 acetylase RimI-like enzyme